MNQYAEKRLQEQKEMREMVEQVVEGHKNAKQAKIKLRKYKQQIGIYILQQKWEIMPSVTKLFPLSFSGLITIFTERKGKLRERSRLCIPMNAWKWIPGISW